ncbi:MAG: serine/threonine protein kinase [Planctomycetota bacterium]|nr:MAG: serine/threonine protein kinase [Planctomycetota bacterium]
MAKLPDRIGPLTLQQQLGMGRQCQVWSAFDTSTGTQVAVKILVPEYSRDRSQRRQLEHELRVGQNLQHPNLIRVHRLSEYQGLFCLVMDLFQHPNLRRCGASAAERERTRPKVVKILTGIAEALGHLHGLGWVHRDVKPANVLVGPDGDVKVLDYAIAAQPPGFLGKLLWTKKQAQGTPSYMAPEQIRGQPPDFRSDVYSLGCVAYEMLAGAPPFTGSDQNDLLGKHIYANPPVVEAANRNVTPAASKLIRQMMAKKLADRPATMQDVVRGLKTIRLFERDPGADSMPVEKHP